ncbi:HpcH/HpaI aldolase family protein [Saccharopolyspora sp. NPDC000995]
MSDQQPLKDRLDHRPVLGTFLKLPRPEVVEVLAIAGLDFVICDTEHGQITETDAHAVIQAGRAAGVAVTVRVPTPDRGQVNRLLEAGAAGIQLSGVTSASQATQLRELTSYPPAGTRSLSTAQPAARYGSIPLPQYLSAANTGTLRIGQLETARYADPLEDILAALDLAFIGVMDLSVDLGCAGDTDAPQVRTQIERIETAARSTGTPLGTFAATTQAARTALDAGYRYIALASDLALLTSAARARFEGLIDHG